MSSSTSAGRLAGADGVRAFAVLLVVFGHALVPGFHAGGIAGVHLFFVLSGFLITGLLLREFDASGRIDLPAFWGRRALRLLPALWLFLAVVVLVWWLAGWSTPAQLARGAVPSLFYYANYVPRSELGPFTHTWSLGVEEQFYLSWPLVLLVLLLATRRLGPRARCAALLGGTGVLLVASAWWRLAHGDNATSPSMLHTTAFALLAGGCLAIAHHFGWRVRPGRTAAVVAVLAAAGLLWGNLLTDAAGMPGDWIHLALLYAALGVVLIAATSGAGGTPFHLGVLGRIGTVSYGWYLWHYPLMSVADHGALAGPGRPFRLAAVVLGSLAIAAASWRWVEQPLLRRYRGRLQRSSLTVGPVEERVVEERARVS